MKWSHWQSGSEGEPHGRAGIYPRQKMPCGLFPFARFMRKPSYTIGELFAASGAGFSLKA
jgi:hypothetical protein